MMWASRVLRHPVRALRTAWSRLAPRDETAALISSWRWGRLPRQPLSAVFPTAETVELRLLRVHDRVRGASLEIPELVALCSIVVSRGARNLLEIGTQDGNTTLNLAANLPAGGHVTTVDLAAAPGLGFALEVPKDQRNLTHAGNVGRQFLGSELAERISLVIADSAAVDWAATRAPFDLAFIDGCHWAEYVRLDTDNALGNLIPGGLIVWHDYGSLADTSRVVDDYATRFRVAAIAGTRLAVGFPELPPAELSRSRRDA